MSSAIRSIEAMFAAVPLPLLKTWGEFGYQFGLVLMVCAFGGFTLRPAGRWGLGREVQTWDAQALRSVAFTFALILATGYVGSFIVLVPGAQTFESLKDLAVFLCIVLFGYPALIVVPFAYGLSDLIEGVPPAFVLDWSLGYFINPACFWVGYRLIGKDPDFRRVRTWARYALFVLVFMSVEPQLWGYICAGKFTPEISYRTITPALFFTTSITWVMAPIAMMIALPLARRLGLYWAEIPGHVRERAVGRSSWVWTSGGSDAHDGPRGIPLRMFLAMPFIVLVLVMVATTAYLTLSSAENSANKLARRLHQETSDNINLRLDAYLEKSPDLNESRRIRDISRMLKESPIAGHGRAFIFDRSGRPIASSTKAQPGEPFSIDQDLVAQSAIAGLRHLEPFNSAVQFEFHVVTAAPLARETWLAQATPYQDHGGGTDWILMTAMPAAYYLEGVQAGNSRSAMVLAAALLVSLLVAAYLATRVAAPICRIARASQDVMNGNLTQRVPDSRLEELSALSGSFNSMAEQLRKSFDDLLNEVEVRKKREHELEESEARARLSEDRLQLATRAAHLGIWDWDVAKDELVWDDTMYEQYGIDRQAFGGAYEAWSRCVVHEDFEQANADVRATLRGERDFVSEFRIKWPDGSIRHIKAMAQAIRDKEGRPRRMVGINSDITEQKRAADEIMQLNTELELRVAERTAQLEAANKELAAFSYSVSHDLKAPLRGIAGYSHLLEDSAAERLSEEGRLFLRNIRQGVAQMQTLIDDLLAYARMERRTLGNEVVDLSASMDAVMRGYSRDVAERGITLRSELPLLTVRADREGLFVVLRNLVDNAFKFSSGARPPTVELGARDADGRVILWVRDNGIGFDMKYHERIFEMFSRLQRAEDYSGTGVGLALVRKAVQRMGGRVWAESTPGQGATFFVELPHG